MGRERVLTGLKIGKVLTNAGVWSPDSRWIAFDTRSHPAGSMFDGVTLEAVHVLTRETRTLFRSQNEACCGVVTWHPTRDEIVFILGPEHPGRDGFQYAAAQRHGVILEVSTGKSSILDARDLGPTFTPGSLAGGSHVHQFSPDGQRISFTYDDYWLTAHGTNARTVAVGELGRPVSVPLTHARNHAGTAMCGLIVTPQPGSITRSYEEAWVGPGSSRLAFLGDMATPDGVQTDVFLADLPARFHPQQRGAAAEAIPALPGVQLTRLTTCGVSGPRFWPRANPAGDTIAFVQNDECGLTKLGTVRVSGGEPWWVPHLHSVESAFTWRPDGERIACVLAGRVALVEVRTGQVQWLTAPGPAETAPRPEACVVSPDGRWVAYIRSFFEENAVWNQVCVAATDD